VKKRRQAVGAAQRGSSTARLGRVDLVTEGRRGRESSV
jgi:hypothetical protein